MLVVCHGMNRSGSTLQYNLVRRMIEELRVGAAYGSFEYRGDGSRDSLTHAINDPAYHVIKLHHASPEVLDFVKRGPAKITYIHRDIRDVAASMKRMRPITLQDIFARLDGLLATYSTLRDLDDGDLILWQEYQPVVDDIPTAAGELARFLGLEADGALIKQVAEEWSLAGVRQVTQALRQNLDDELLLLGAHSEKGQELRRKMRTKELVYGDHVSLLHYNHISPDGGAPGTWRSQLTEDEIDILTDRYRWWLVNTGFIPQ